MRFLCEERNIYLAGVCILLSEIICLHQFKLTFYESNYDCLVKIRCSSAQKCKSDYVAVIFQYIILYFFINRIQFTRERPKAFDEKAYPDDLERECAYIRATVEVSRLRQIAFTFADEHGTNVEGENGCHTFQFNINIHTR